jgi:hypothetical protein
VGPAFLRWLVHRRLGAVHYVLWARVDRIDDGAVRIPGPSRTSDSTGDHAALLTRGTDQILDRGDAAQRLPHGPG